MKMCPDCIKTDLQDDAIICKHCGSKQILPEGGMHQKPEEKFKAESKENFGCAGGGRTGCLLIIFFLFFVHHFFKNPLGVDNNSSKSVNHIPEHVRVDPKVRAENRKAILAQREKAKLAQAENEKKKLVQRKKDQKRSRLLFRKHHGGSDELEGIIALFHKSFPEDLTSRNAIVPVIGAKNDAVLLSCTVSYNGHRWLF